MKILVKYKRGKLDDVNIICFREFELFDECFVFLLLFLILLIYFSGLKDKNDLLKGKYVEFF